MKFKKNYVVMSVKVNAVFVIVDTVVAVYML